MKARYELLLNLSIRHGPDVQQQIRIIPGGTHQHLLDLLGALEVVVADVETPGSIKGIAAFERQTVSDIVCVESGRVLARQIPLERLNIFSWLWGLMVVGNNQRC